jgi:tRNA threonylcarbamoyladenosine biosynthesis protein TsaE
LDTQIQHEQKIQYTLMEIDQTAAYFLSLMRNNRHLAFYGEMGAGKTTFITALCHKLKAVDLVSSPSFAIINEYRTETGDNIYHFDFYRIKTPVELLDIGFYDYCSSDAYCFIEWPDRAEEILPVDFLKVALTVKNDNSRILTFTL